MDNKILQFKRETHFQGRNGYFRCTGLKISHFSDKIVDIYPLTSKGIIGNCQLEIPLEEIDNLIEILKQIKYGITL